MTKLALTMQVEANIFSGVAINLYHSPCYFAKYSFVFASVSRELKAPNTMCYIQLVLKTIAHHCFSCTLS